jgi:hypothetical protein
MHIDLYIMYNIYKLTVLICTTPYIFEEIQKVPEALRLKKKINTYNITLKNKLYNKHKFQILYSRLHPTIYSYCSSNHFLNHYIHNILI